MVSAFCRFPEVLGSLVQVVSPAQKSFPCSLTSSGLANPIFSKEASPWPVMIINRVGRDLKDHLTFPLDTHLLDTQGCDIH